MEIGSALIIFGLYCVILCFASFSLGNFLERKSLKAPSTTLFSTMVSKRNKFDNIATPALASLGAGFFMSVAASAFYTAMTDESKSNQAFLCLLFFVIGVGFLFVLLKDVMKAVDINEDVASDPFAIKAAADDYIKTNGNGPLSLDVLEKNLSRWSVINLRKPLGVTLKKTKKESSGINEKLTKNERKLSDCAKSIDGIFNTPKWKGVKDRTFRKDVKLRVQRHFKLRFRFPSIVTIISTAACVVWAFIVAREPWAMNYDIIAFIGIVLTFVSKLFLNGSKIKYVVAWYDLYRPAELDARRSLAKARSLRAKNNQLSSVSQVGVNNQLLNEATVADASLFGWHLRLSFRKKSS